MNWAGDIPRCLRAALLAALLAMPACADDQAASAAAYGQRGSLAVGFRRLEGPGGLPIKSWYPALNPSGAKEEIAYPVALKVTHWGDIAPAIVEGQALADARLAAANGPYPLVVFSHGYGVSPEWYSGLVEHYASRGFIVLAPEHTEDDWLRALEASFDRPNDVARTLDFAEALTAADGTWAGQLDLENVAVVGHSYGGYTALALAGARFDLGPFKARCAALTADDPKNFLCAPFVAREADMAARAGLAAVPEGLWPTTMVDPRVTAIVPMAGDAYLMNERGLANVTVPMMALGGTEDVGTPFDWGAELAYESASSRLKSLVAFEGADHMIPVNPCESMPFTAQLPEVEREFFCLDAPSWERRRAQIWIRHLSTAFLLDVLSGDRDARAALLPGAVAESGLGFITTLR